MCAIAQNPALDKLMQKISQLAAVRESMFVPAAWVRQYVTLDVCATGSRRCARNVLGDRLQKDYYDERLQRGNRLRELTFTGASRVQSLVQAAVDATRQLVHGFVAEVFEIASQVRETREKRIEAIASVDCVVERIAGRSKEFGVRSVKERSAHRRGLSDEEHAHARGKEATPEFFEIHEGTTGLSSDVP